ncbi:1375_t:CDS:2, partial [Ambispora leptoticha]
DSCGDFHYQILSQIQIELNDPTITQNNYVLAYKVAKETGAGTQIINESSCWVTEAGHLKLTGMHYTTWAGAIITDIDTPPSHAIFTSPPKIRGISNSNQLLLQPLQQS